MTCPHGPLEHGRQFGTLQYLRGRRLSTWMWQLLHPSSLCQLQRQNPHEAMYYLVPRRKPVLSHLRGMGKLLSVTTRKLQMRDVLSMLNTGDQQKSGGPVVRETSCQNGHTSETVEGHYL
jgi:hypothetical protein